MYFTAAFHTSSSLSTGASFCFHAPAQPDASGLDPVFLILPSTKCSIWALSSPLNILERALAFPVQSQQCRSGSHRAHLHTQHLCNSTSIVPAANPPSVEAVRLVFRSLYQYSLLLYRKGNKIYQCQASLHLCVTASSLGMHQYKNISKNSPSQLTVKPRHKLRIDQA